jgi:Fe-Mn family superoxide dismutase
MNARDKATSSINLLSTSFFLTADAMPTSTTKQTTLFQAYEAKNYDYLLGNVTGIHDDLLRMHFKLYQGYVANTNKLLLKIRQMQEQGKGAQPEFAGLERMLGWEFDGMRLHEYYFENLGGNGELDPNTALHKKITEMFGSFENWKKEFTQIGQMRGIGWVVLYQDPKTGRLINTWINEHDTGHLAGATPLVIMDVFEHAYITQFGLDRTAYINAFFDNLNWMAAQKRFL